MRFQPTREFLAKGYPLKVQSKTCAAVVYMSNDDLKPRAMGFIGKANKPSFHFNFRSVERRAEYVADWFKNQEAWAKSKAERKAKTRAFVHTLKVGDILSTSWGYDQTNVEFFQVTRLIAKTMVEVREICQLSEETGFMSGQCSPRANSFKANEKPLRRRVLEGNILDIHNAGYGRASLYEQIEVAPGIKVGPSKYWSSYA